MNAQTVERVLDDHEKDIAKHSEDISTTKKAVIQVEKTLIALEAAVKPMVRLMWFIGLGVLASVGAMVWNTITVHGSILVK